MGAATSSNAAEAVTNVTNFVTNSTSADSQQMAYVNQTIDLHGCEFVSQHDINIDQTVEYLAINKQVAQASSDTNLMNNIAQQVGQEASSTVGSMGIGFASAHNSASTFADSTNSIQNAVKTESNQIANINQDVLCDGSYFRGRNINITQNVSAQLLSDQVLENDNVAQVVNKIDQTLTQKASATVEGLGSLLFAIAAIIIAFGYFLSKPLTTGPVKYVTLFAIAIIILVAIAWAASAKLPPFFNEDDKCVQGSTMGCPGSECINTTDDEVRVSSPPLKYLYAIADLFGMVVPKLAGANSIRGAGPNGGYTIDTLINLDSKLQQFQHIADALGIDNIPNPLIDPALKWKPSTKTYLGVPAEFIPGNNRSCTPMVAQATDRDSASSGCSAFINYKNLDGSDTKSESIANYDDNLLNDWLTADTQTMNTKAIFARFVTSEILDLEGTRGMYINNDEPVSYIDGNTVKYAPNAASVPKDFQKQLYQFKPTKKWTNPVEVFKSGGVISGQFGVCDNSTYRFHQTMRKEGLIAMFIILVPMLGFMIFKKSK